MGLGRAIFERDPGIKCVDDGWGNANLFLFFIFSPFLLLWVEFVLAHCCRGYTS